MRGGRGSAQLAAGMTQATAYASSSLPPTVPTSLVRSDATFGHSSTTKNAYQVTRTTPHTRGCGFDRTIRATPCTDPPAFFSREGLQGRFLSGDDPALGSPVKCFSHSPAQAKCLLPREYAARRAFIANAVDRLADAKNLFFAAKADIKAGYAALRRNTQVEPVPVRRQLLSAALSPRTRLNFDDTPTVIVYTRNDVWTEADSLPSPESIRIAAASTPSQQTRSLLKRKFTSIPLTASPPPPVLVSLSPLMLSTRSTGVGLENGNSSLLTVIVDDALANHKRARIMLSCSDDNNKPTDRSTYSDSLFDI